MSFKALFFTLYRFFTQVLKVSLCAGCIDYLCKYIRCAYYMRKGSSRVLSQCFLTRNVSLSQNQLFNLSHLPPGLLVDLIRYKMLLPILT